MSTRRKYRDGGAVPVMPADDLPASAGIDQEPAPRVDVSLAPAPDPADNALSQALASQLRAEQMSRQPRQEGQEQPTSIEQFVDHIPGLSDHKRQFLKANPDMLNGEPRELMASAYAEAIEAGFRDDSAELDRFLIQTVRSELGARRQRLADAARAAASLRPPEPVEPTIERMAQQLETDAESYGQIGHALDAMPTSVGADFVAAPPAAPRRRMPMTAPVSRDGMSFGGVPGGGSGQVTLTAEERAIARSAFTDPNMSAAEKERSYAMQKAKLARMRAEGRYPERERN